MILNQTADLKKYLPNRPEDSHKGTFGKALIIAGCRGFAGAAYLSAYATYIAGTGLVKIYTHKSNRVILQELLPEAMVRVYRNFDEKEQEELKEDLSWCSAVVIGPGMGLSEVSEKIFQTTTDYLCCHSKPSLIDADGLTLLAKKKNLLLSFQTPPVLTPHPKEMEALWGKNRKEICENPQKIAEEFLKMYPAILIIKGYHTLVSDSFGHLYINHTGNCGMAKGGSGDILSGVIGGLLAQGMESYTATVCGVFLHGAGGDIAREEKGAISMIARDLIEGIAMVLKELD